MLLFVRLLGFLAPFSVAGLVIVSLAVVAQTQPTDRGSLAFVIGAAIVAGMTTMALLAWSYIGWPLNRIAQALERTLEADEAVLL
ncbi:MAG: hypothetical protein ACR2GO_08855, partial [Candidatus Limnocylindria bacterium]